VHAEFGEHPSDRRLSGGDPASQSNLEHGCLAFTRKEKIADFRLKIGRRCESLAILDLRC
jgi:hypothetical protein